MHNTVERMLGCLALSWSKLVFLIFILVVADSAAQAGCRWDGTAPSCSGKCNPNETEVQRAGGITSPFSSEGMPDFGKACILGGTKALCCTREETKVISGCVIEGVFHPEIAPSDCLEAQKVGCIRSKLTDEQYVNCLNAQKRPGTIKHTNGQPKKQKAEATATGADLQNEREEERKITGRTEQECIGINRNCEVRRKTRFGFPASIGIIAKECTPYFQQCMANAVQDRAAKVQPDNSGGNGEGGGGGGQSMASVVKSVDVYDAPGGDGQKTGKLRRGAKVSLIGDCADDWCHVAGARVPNGDGYVYNGDDYRSLNF
jgi:hypothetical protein